MRLIATILVFLLPFFVNAQIIVNGHIHATPPGPPEYDTMYSGTLWKFSTGIGSTDNDGWAAFVNNDPNYYPSSGVRTRTVSGVTLNTNNTSAWNLYYGGTGNVTGGEDNNDGGGFAVPAAVLRDIVINGGNDTYSGNTSDASFRISGLTPDSLYRVRLYPSVDQDVCSALSTTYEMKAILIDKNYGFEYSMYSDGTKTPPGGASPSADGIVICKNTSKWIEMHGRANASGYLFIWIGPINASVGAIGACAAIDIQKGTIITLTLWPLLFLIGFKRKQIRA